MQPSIKHLAISQTPYRISLGGGGTDLPFYARERGGLLISATINQYTKVSVATRPLDDKILCQTTITQFVERLDDLENEIVREVLRYFELSKAIQVATFTTVPTGIGLGTSSTLIVGLVKSISVLLRKRLSPMEIAYKAHYIEREILKFPGGTQDQYISALGGIQILKVNKSGEVTAQPLVIEEDCRYELEKRLVLVYTGVERDSRKIIKSQQVDHAGKIEVYDEIKKIGKQSVDLLKKADLEGLGQAMDKHWNLKKKLSKEMSTTRFDKMYLQLKKMGSSGGKIIGAGGGGFFMMAVPGDVDAYLNKIGKLGFRHLKWWFEFKGTHLIDVGR
jgi:D-glycero-alpha-D-manno-heptose-7-phosphate kinase